MARRRLLNTVLMALVLAILYFVICLSRFPPTDTGSVRDSYRDIQVSGEAFPLGNVAVVLTFRYSDDGDRLRYLVVQTWPVATPSDVRLADRRYDANAYPLPLVRRADDSMKPVETDGHVYFFIDDELRTMRVAMNEHTDTIGLHNAKSVEEMWTYLQRFRVPDKSDTPK
jgi:hypothetical protein